MDVVNQSSDKLIDELTSSKEEEKNMAIKNSELQIEINNIQNLINQNYALLQQNNELTRKNAKMEMALEAIASYIDTCTMGVWRHRVMNIVTRGLK